MSWRSSAALYRAFVKVSFPIIDISALRVPMRVMLALLGCRCRVQFAEQSVALLIRSGSEEQRVRRARVRVPLAELQGPQTVDLQRSPGCGVELTELHRLAGSPRADEVECVDL